MYTICQYMIIYGMIRYLLYSVMSDFPNKIPTFITEALVHRYSME